MPKIQCLNINRPFQSNLSTLPSWPIPSLYDLHPYVPATKLILKGTMFWMFKIDNWRKLKVLGVSIVAIIIFFRLLLGPYLTPLSGLIFPFQVLNSPPASFKLLLLFHWPHPTHIPHIRTPLIFYFLIKCILSLTTLPYYLLSGSHDCAYVLGYF